MKRVGYVYDTMWNWDKLVEAEWVSTKRKSKNIGVIQHSKHRIKNLVEIQGMILGDRMHTSSYKFMRKVSGQNKMRNISKLDFHPSHIEHQLLTIAATERVEKGLIRQTYASRIGMGQLRCALKIKSNLRKWRGTERWYCQCDIRKYYENIPHDYLRGVLNGMFKDKRFIDSFMEPFEAFSKSGIGVPLGIRPSQIAGNLALMKFDHFMKEDVKVEDYVRYLDDFLFTGATKGEVRYKYKRAAKYLNDIGFELHEPKIHRVSEGIDTMGFVFYGTRKDMWWRKSNKVKWLKHRARLTNKKRIAEIDASAWGMLKWGNSDGKKLINLKTNGKFGKKMSVSLNKMNIRRSKATDKNGVPYIDENKISMSMILGKPVVINEWVKGITTRCGDDRYALRLELMGAEYKLIVNAIDIKNFINDMENAGVTKVRTVFSEPSPRHYKVDSSKTEIIEINKRNVIEKDGIVVYEDSLEPVYK